MKRDWDVIRRVLVDIEALPSADAMVESHKLERIEPNLAAYNMRLLLKEGLIEGGGRLESMPGADPWIFASQLTWDGHELLDSIRRDTLWERIKATAASKGLDLTIDVVKGISRTIAEQLIKQM